MTLLPVADRIVEETNVDVDDRTSLLKGDGDAFSSSSSQSLSDSQPHADRKPRLRTAPSQPLMHESPARRTMAAFRSHSTVLQHENTNMGAQRFQRQDSHGSFRSQSRSFSDVDGVTAPDTPLRPSLTRHLSELDKERQRRANDDLQSWMQRQQVSAWS